MEQLENIDESQALEEELFLGLRQLSGIDLDGLQRSYGVSIGERFTALESSGLIEREGSVVRLAPEHLSISNEVFVELMR
jgi:coproporphyrinogen III oxidase-like Fe-S oxidoreductase